MKKPITVNVKGIGKFLKSMKDADFGFLYHTVKFRYVLEDLIKRHKLTKEYVCEKFEISASDYANFISGNYNYSLRNFASYEVALVELEQKKIEDDVLAQKIERRKA